MNPTPIQDAYISLQTAGLTVTYLRNEEILIGGTGTSQGVLMPVLNDVFLIIPQDNGLYNVTLERLNKSRIMPLAEAVRWIIETLCNEP